MRNGMEQEGTCIIDGPSLRAPSWKRGEGANGPELAAATGVRGELLTTAEDIIVVDIQEGG